VQHDKTFDYEFIREWIRKRMGVMAVNNALILATLTASAISLCLIYYDIMPYEKSCAHWYCRLYPFLPIGLATALIVVLLASSQRLRLQIAEVISAVLPFPTNELKVWLKGRSSWNRGEWLALLADLRMKGYRTLTDTDDGQRLLGEFLQEHRESSKKV
jgi:hypothetical protein